MKKLKLINLIIFLTLLWVFHGTAHSQNQQQAENAVISYMKLDYPDYIPKSFGDVYIQTYPKEVQKELKTTKPVVYSISHTYYLGEKVFDLYSFQLDENMNVIGYLTDDQMMNIMTDILFSSKTFMEVIDSAGIDTTKFNKNNTLESK
jgi:hypothetical protein